MLFREATNRAGRPMLAVALAAFARRRPCPKPPPRAAVPFLEGQFVGERPRPGGCDEGTPAGSAKRQSCGGRSPTSPAALLR